MLNIKSVKHKTAPPVRSGYSPVSERSSTEDDSTIIGDLENSSLLPELNSEKVLLGPGGISHWRRVRLQDIVITTLTTLLIIIISQIIYFRLINSPHKRFHTAIQTLYGEETRVNPTYHCGNSSTEALSLGCVFEISVVGWVPAQCQEPELNQRFLDYGWKFFEDKEGIREVGLDRLASSAGSREPFWVQHGYHVTHCELAWQRMHRAMQTGGRLTTHLLNEEHTRHCGGIIEMRDDLMSINAQIMPLLNSC